jgi:hypothetical protein
LIDQEVKVANALEYLLADEIRWVFEYVSGNQSRRSIDKFDVVRQVPDWICLRIVVDRPCFCYRFFQQRLDVSVVVEEFYQLFSDNVVLSVPPLGIGDHKFI